MKKTHVILMIVLTLALMTGCSADSATVAGEGDIAVTEAGDASSESQTTVEATQARLDENGMPDRKAEVSGVVKSIIGNEVTISLLLKNQSQQSESSSSETSTELSEAEKAAKQAAKQAENQAKRATGESGTGMTEIELSGETVDLVIPVGTKILQSTGTGEFFELNIADLARGMSVKIWLVEGGEGETKLAEFVQIITR